MPIRRLGVGSVLDDRFALRSVLAESPSLTTWTASDRVRMLPARIHVVPGRAHAAITERPEAVRSSLEASTLQPQLLLAEGPGAGVHIAFAAGGTTLADALAAGPIDRRRALAVGRDIGAALAALHAAGIAHGLVRPSAIELADSEAGDAGPMASAAPVTARLTDAGLFALFRPMSVAVLARRFGDDVVVAPETQERVVASAAADVYALGVVLADCVTGVRPDVDDLLARLAAVRAAHLPAALRNLLERMLDTEPDARPTAAQVVSVLQLREHGLSTERHAGTPWRAPRRSARRGRVLPTDVRRRRIRRLVGLATAAVCLVGGAMILRPDPGVPSALAQDIDASSGRASLAPTGTRTPSAAAPTPRSPVPRVRTSRPTATPQAAETAGGSTGGSSTASPSTSTSTSTSTSRGAPPTRSGAATPTSAPPRPARSAPAAPAPASSPPLPSPSATPTVSASTSAAPSAPRPSAAAPTGTATPAAPTTRSGTFPTTATG